MTPRERAIEATWDTGAGDWTTADREHLEKRVEQAITAAVEEDRRARPHTFVGRTDRYCELCNEPDRDEIHIASREMMRNWVKLAVEEEREACAQIADDEYDSMSSARLAYGGLLHVAEKIRARNNGEQDDAGKR